MPTRHLAACLLIPSLLCSALLLVGCTTKEDALGKEGNADGGQDAKASDVRPITCEQDGRTYQVGETVALGACTSCVCQKDGSIGMCTGLCPPDAAISPDVAVTCTDNGRTYQVGENIRYSACLSCVCQKDGTIGMCTGDCPPDAAPAPDVAVTCTDNGKTYQVGETVVRSACTTCVCQKDGTIGMCTADCPPDAATTVDAAGTCTLDGKSYPVGTRVGGSGCVSCVCLADGTWGQCTGACPPADARTIPDADLSPSALCTQTHGQVTTSQCCLSATDFPNTCLEGTCGCSSANSHAVKTCSCPAGTCFDPADGCVGIPGACTPGQDQTCNADPTSSSTVGYCGDDGSCLCIFGTTREANGKCRPPSKN